MPIEKIIILEDIGEIKLIKDKRFKRLSVRMAPKKGIWINLPFAITFEEGIEFALSHKAWMIRNKKKILAKENQQTIFDLNTIYKTRFHQLRLLSLEIKNFTAKLSNGILEVNFPRQISVQNQELQNFIRNSIVETLRREANYYLPKRLDELAKKNGFTYKTVRIKNTSSRWGSCSHDNNINLNLHLLRLPEELSDMVILHELCHTKIKNHSQDFWNLLEKHCPNLLEKRRKLKNYSTKIF